MSLGNNSNVSQARGKNVAIKVKQEKERIAAKEGGGGRRGGRR
jgi:hypothetical protein